MTVWTGDFTYRFYRMLLQTIRETFEVKALAAAPQFLTNPHDVNGPPRLILRHDIDFDMERAVTMAEIEYEYGIRACYMIMTTCPFYNIEVNRDRLQRLLALGHGIGLHFDYHDFASRKDGVADPADSARLLEAIDKEAGKLEAVIDQPVRAISFHRPLPQFLRGPLLIGGRVNAYARDLMQWYLSDSKGQWRHGNPLPALRQPSHDLLQLLIHPFWWGERHYPARVRLQQFFDDRTRGLSPEERSVFDRALAQHVTVRRISLST